ncbi:chromosome alignment-maintaining phosphoprotein 1-like [Sycon ciliatum]|uniref:chromosome alignment-maintaining phosphoprotein 1-like n=1 Tax=Sycon ciliatum TaxID=27933 RepID=UPI0031F6C438
MMDQEMESFSIARPAAVGRMRRSTSVPDMRSPDFAYATTGEAAGKPKSSLAKKALDLSPLTIRRPLVTSSAACPTASAADLGAAGMRRPAPIGPRRSLPDSLPLEPVHFNPIMNRLLKEEDPRQELLHERSVMQNASLSKTFEVAMPSSPSPSIELPQSQAQVTSTPGLYSASPSNSLTTSMSPSSPRFLPRLSSRAPSPCPSPTRRSFTSRLGPSTPIIKTSPLDLKRPRRASSSDVEELVLPLAKRPVTTFFTSSPRSSGAASPLLLNLNGPTSPRPITSSSGWSFSTDHPVVSSSAAHGTASAGASEEEKRWCPTTLDCPSPMDMSIGDMTRRSEPLGIPTFPLTLSQMSAFSRDESQGSPMCLSDSESMWGIASPKSTSDNQQSQPQEQQQQQQPSQPPHRSLMPPVMSPPTSAPPILTPNGLFLGR